MALVLALAEGPDPEVALEATYGSYWAVDLLQASGAKAHLVHPLGLHWAARRVTNDRRDATEIAQRLRRHDLPEAWIAPPQLRELRYSPRSGRLDWPHRGADSPRPGDQHWRSLLEGGRSTDRPFLLGGGTGHSAVGAAERLTDSSSSTRLDLKEGSV